MRNIYLWVPFVRGKNHVDGLRVVTAMIITLLYSGMSHCAICCMSAAPSSGWENKHIHRTVAVNKK
jgi:hypothetical protein